MKYLSALLLAGTPQQFAAMANADRAKWKKIITDRKIAAE